MNRFVKLTIIKMFKKTTMTMTEINILIKRIMKMVGGGLMEMGIKMKAIKYVRKTTIHLMKEIMLTITHSRLV